MARVMNEAQRRAQQQAREDAFAEALKRCGFNSGTVEFIRSQGLKTGLDLQALDAKSFAAFQKHAGSWRPKPTKIPEEPAAAPAAPIPGDESSVDRRARQGEEARVAAERAAQREAQLAEHEDTIVQMPFLSSLKLKAFHLYAQYRQARGEDFEVNTFDGQIIPFWIERLNVINGLKEDEPPAEPVRLKDYEGWYDWKDGFLLWAVNTRSSMLAAPFTYLIRERIPVEPHALGVKYDQVDEDLEATMHHLGYWYRHDNNALWDMLKTSTSGGIGATQVAKFAKKRDGRAAWEALLGMAEGPAGTATLRKRMYAKIAAVEYTGKGGMKLSTLINVLEKCYITLARTEEIVAETKQVQDLLESTKAPHLTTAKDVINGDDKKLKSFKSSAQYLLMCDRNTTNPLKRKVGSATRKRENRKKKKKNKLNTDLSKNKPSDFDPATRVENPQFRAWTPAQRQEWAKMKEAAGIRTVGAVEQQPVAPAEEAMLAALRIAKASGLDITVKNAVSDDASDDAATEAAPRKGAGKEFGRKAHKKD